jgi:hypothetical protein
MQRLRGFLFASRLSVWPKTNGMMDADVMTNHSFCLRPFSAPSGH